MKLQILFDSNAADERFRTGWGLSMLLGGRFLFDTGADGEALLANMRALGADPAALAAVMLSHGHYDHDGGLAALLDLCPDLPVFVGDGVAGNCDEILAGRANPVTRCKDWTQIVPDMWCSGSLPALYKGAPMPEQFLVVRTARGLNIITGCAHPGIADIVRHARARFADEEIVLVLGGFHLRGRTDEDIRSVAEELKSMDVRSVAPLHCSGPRSAEVFAEVFGQLSPRVPVGAGIEI